MTDSPTYAVPGRKMYARGNVVLSQYLFHQRMVADIALIKRYRRVDRLPVAVNQIVQNDDLSCPRIEKLDGQASDITRTARN